MKIEDVKKLSPTERFLYFITEREAIRLKREAGEPPPWTDDLVLASYRFTNVRRMDDRVSRWLLERWYAPNFGHKNALIACALARFINKPETLELIGYPKRWEPERIKKVIRKIQVAGKTAYNAAYMIRGNDGEDKAAAVVDHYVGGLVKNRPVIDPTSMENTWRALECRFGYGSFMAGQVVADLVYATPGTWEDRRCWAPIGPGSRKGVNRVLGRPPETPISQEYFNDYLQGIISLCESELPASIISRLDAIDIQNCLCELSKAEKAWWGEGRPKQRYNGRG